jgi:excisionase family DNA binding protein
MIYFIRCGSAIKIGYTSNSAEKRLADLQPANPCPLTLLCVVDGSTSDEAALHRTFSHLLIHGEWYAATEELLQFIAGVSEAGTLSIERHDTEYLTGKQAAAVLGVTKVTAINMCKDGRLRSKKVSGYKERSEWRIDCASVHEYIVRRKAREN